MERDEVALLKEKEHNTHLLGQIGGVFAVVIIVAGAIWLLTPEEWILAFILGVSVLLNIDRAILGVLRGRWRVFGMHAAGTVIFLVGFIFQCLQLG